MRTYENSHPWITFRATELNDLDPKLWMLLGEARSKCEHLAGTPLQPKIADQLYRVTLIKGALATTAIEGNTLTEEQVAGILKGTYKVPASRAYQAREVKNVLEALTEIAEQIVQGQVLRITPDLICGYNFKILEGTEYEPHVIPGRVRNYSVGVLNYRGAPAEDCEYLLVQLCDWLESDIFRNDDPEINFTLAVACAIYAHLYIAWIHPFGEGNGRTARLIEFLILARCGMVPLPAAQLLSNHYNLTRDQYYRELSKSSRTSKTVKFLTYAMQGLVDGIRDQISQVRVQQFNVTWVNYVHETMGQFSSSPSRDRQLSLILAMPSDKAIPRNELAGLTPHLAALYAKAGQRTLSRDLNRLMEVKLIVKKGRDWQSNTQIIKAFLPPMAEVEPSSD